MTIPEGFEPINKVETDVNIPEGFEPYDNEPFVNKLGKAFSFQSKMAAPSPQAQAETAASLLSGATLGLSKLATDKMLPNERLISPSATEIFETVGETAPLGSLQYGIGKAASRFFPKSTVKKALSTIGGMAVSGAGYETLKDAIDQDKKIDLEKSAKTGALWGGIESILQSIPSIGKYSKKIINIAKKSKPKNPEEISVALDKAITQLDLPNVVDREGKPFRGIQPKVFGGEKEKIREKLIDQTETLVNQIKKEKIPVAQEIEKGINVRERNAELLNNLSKISEGIPEKIESKPLSDYYNEIEKRIHETPSPSEAEKEILELLPSLRNKFASDEGGTRFYSVKEWLNQFRANNQDAKDAFQKWIKTGKGGKLIKFYEGQNNIISKMFEEQTPKKFSELFSFTNDEFSQIKKLDKFDDLMKSFETDGTLNAKKLYKHVLNEKNERSLTNVIGKEGFNRLKVIAEDLKKAEKNLKLIDEINLNGIIKSGLTWGILSKLIGYKIALPIKVAKEAIAITRGYMYLSPKGFKNTDNFLKAIRSGSPKAITNTLQKLDNDAVEYENEFNH